MALEERVELDISEALRGIDNIEDALTASAQGFKVALAEALDLLSTVAMPEVDAAAISSSLTAAVEAADLEPEILADAGGVTEAIDAAVTGADTDLALDADASAVEEALSEAVEGAASEVSVTADASTIPGEIEEAVDAGRPDAIRLDADARAITDEIGDAIDAAPTDVPLTADTSEIPESIEEAIDSADDEVILRAITDAITSGIEEAIAAADATAEVTGDASDVTASVDDALAAAMTEIILSGDASSIPAEVEAAIAEAPDEVVIAAIADGITAVIEEAIAAADATVEVEADTSSAEASMNQLGETARETSDGLGDTGAAVEGLSGLAAASTGSLVGLERAVGGMGAGAKAAAGGVAAVTGVVGLLFKGALDAETANIRFAQALGGLADEVADIRIDGLAENFDDLAQKTGNSDEAMKLAVARLADLGNSAGASQEQIAGAAENIALLAIRATTLNPTLGDAGAVADQLAVALARGGRPLAQFGLSLTSTEIAAEAAARGLGEDVNALSIFERAAIGADLVTQQLGASLRDDIREGAQNTEIQLRRLGQEFGDTLEAFGEPLLAPVIEAIESGQPILLDLAEVFGELGGTLVPVAIDALKAAAPTISTVADIVQILLAVLRPVLGIIDAIPDPVLAGVAAFALFRATIGPVATGSASLASRIGSLSGPAGFAGLVSPIGLAAAALGTAIGVITAYNARKDEQRRRIQEVTTSLLDETQAIEESIQAQVRERVASRNQEDDLRRLGLSVREFADLTSSGQEGFEDFLDALERTGEVTPAVAAGLRETAGSGDGLGAAVERAGGSIKELQDSNLGLVDSFLALSSEQQKAAQAALTRLVNEEQVTEAQIRQAEATNRNVDETTNYVAALEAVRPSAEGAADAVDELGSTTDSTSRSATLAGLSAEQLAAALEEETVAAKDADDALSGLLDATVALLNTQISTEQANIRFGDSLADVAAKAADLAAAEREHGAASAEATAARREYEDSIRDGRDAALAAAEAELRLAEDTAAASGSALTAQERQDIFRSSLERVAGQATGPTRDAILGLLTTYDTIPAEKRTVLTAETAEAQRKVDELRGRIDNLGRKLTVDIVASNVVRAAQHGGTFGPGPLMVGEAGRELIFISPGTTATVLPNPATESLLSGGGRVDSALVSALQAVASRPVIAPSIAVSAPNASAAYATALETAQQLRALSIRLGINS